MDIALALEGCYVVHLGRQNLTCRQEALRMHEEGVCCGGWIV